MQNVNAASVNSTEIPSITNATTPSSTGATTLPASSAVPTSASSSSTTPAPIDCVASNWSPATSCSQTCGAGYQILTRTVSSQQNSSQPCPTRMYASCNNGDCPGTGANCLFGEWACFGELAAYPSGCQCSALCGGGVLYRQRTLLAGNGSCSASIVDAVACNIKPCTTTTASAQTSTTIAHTSSSATGTTTLTPSIGGAASRSSGSRDTALIIVVGRG